MSLSPSLLLLDILRWFPMLGRSVFAVWMRLNKSWKTEPHWLLVRLADAFDEPLPFFTVLDGHLPMLVVWRDYVGMKIHRQGVYEPETVEAVKKILKPGDVFMDIGAHFGQFTLIASKLVGESGAVHSFEPHPETVRYLRENVQVNACINARVNNLAVSNETALLTFHLGNRVNYGASSLMSAVEDSGRTAQVQTVRLDDYVREQNMERVTLIKADVEGAELRLLYGAEEFLNRADKPFIIMEFNEYTQHSFGQSCSDLAAWLRARGYRLFRVGPKYGLGKYAVNGVDSYFNVLCVPQEKANLLTDMKMTVVEDDGRRSEDFKTGLISASKN